MSDFFDQTFAELDAFYPNSKRKRREPAPVVAPEALDSSWETEYYTKHLPNGKTIHMYTIGSLAKAINRSVKTVRVWIDWGYFPESPYRLPSKTSKKGVVYAGRRLYSKNMILATVEIFTAAGILLTNRVDWSAHRDLIGKLTVAWDTIRAEETTTN